MKNTKKNKDKKGNYTLPTIEGFNVIESLGKITIKTETTKHIPLLSCNVSESRTINKNTPPSFVLDMENYTESIKKQLKKQNVCFDPSVIKSYDKLIKGIIALKREGFITKKKQDSLIYKILQRAIKHVYFIYEMV